jgi:hypothetical protein
MGEEACHEVWDVRRDLLSAYPKRFSTCKELHVSGNGGGEDLRQCNKVFHGVTPGHI